METAGRGERSRSSRDARPRLIVGRLPARLRRAPIAPSDAALDETRLLTTIASLNPAYEPVARHATNVADHAAQIARELGLGPARVARVRRAALLHDIGKLEVPPAILEKPGGLAPDEWSVMRRHPVVAEQMLSGIRGLGPCLPAIRHHHERLDGTGYPDGLRSDAISLDARVLAVADAFDAMTSDRPYRPALTAVEAIRRLRAEAGMQFDPRCVEALVAANRRSWLPTGAPPSVPA
jgi:putative nucleotidyltransferase with HDIG domain